MSKRNLVFYSEAPMIGGAESYLATLINSLDHNGFDIHLIFNTKQFMEAFMYKFTCNINSYVSLPIKPDAKFSRFRSVRFLRGFVYLLLYLRKRKVDILHINYGGFPGGPSLHAAVLVARLLKIPKVLMTVHNLSLNKEPLLSFNRLLDYFVFKYITKVICVSEAVKNSLINNRNAPISKLFVIYNGVTDWKCKIDKEILKQELGIHFGNKIVGMVSTFEKRKGHKYLLEAAFRIVKDHKDVVFLVIGDYTEGIGPEILAIANELGLTEHVHFLGFRRDVRSLMTIFDLLVLPSLEYESFGLVLVEAMTQKIPVVATAIGGIPEVVFDGINGILVPPHDSAILSEAILSLLNNKHEARRMGEEGRKIYEQNFDVSNMSRKVMEAYL